MTIHKRILPLTAAALLLLGTFGCTPKDTAELRECVRALREQKFDCSVITFRSFSKLMVYPDSGIPWSLDGERAEGEAEIPIENLHHAVQIIHPKEES